jgi:hypothetical protein
VDALARLARADRARHVVMASIEALRDLAGPGAVEALDGLERGVA